MTQSKTCAICNSPMHPAHKAELLGSHIVAYFICKNCQFLQTETPYWLDQAYSDAIARTDTGLATRNITNRAILEPILYTLFNEGGKYVDIGGGYGLLTRLLRDIGFDCYTTDQYCDNIFAQDFEPQDAIKANALFAFEVMEHIEDPLTFIRDNFSKYQCTTIIFSTLDYGDAVPKKDWWYYAPETGQHISFYNQPSLLELARRLNCRYIRLSNEYHLLTNHELSRKTVAQLEDKKKFKRLQDQIRKKRRRKSLTWDDHLLARARLEANNKTKPGIT